jgi:hypothetical protein
VTWLFLLLALVVVVATSLALAGRWQPEGLDPGRPQEARAVGEPGRFDVVLRGYRMDQVDAELARLHGELHDRSLDEGREVAGRFAAEMPEALPDPTIEA